MSRLKRMQHFSDQIFNYKLVMLVRKTISFSSVSFPLQKWKNHVSLSDSQDKDSGYVFIYVR